MYNFGQTLHELRKAHNMTQKRLAEKLEITEATVSRYEGGTALPPFEAMRTIAAVFNVSLDYLYGMEKPSVISSIGLTDGQIDILKTLANEFRTRNCIASHKLTEKQALLLGRILEELGK